MSNMSSVRALIHRVRENYLNNPHLGLASWFDVFDQILLQRRFVDCQALLDEIRQGGYLIDERERTYVISRQAALYLCVGVGYQFAQQYRDAYACYEASRNLHKGLNDDNGQGQAMFALDELRRQVTGGNLQRQQLESLANKPRVLGDGPTLLVERLKSLPANEQLQVVVAARLLGYPDPLLSAVAASTPEVQAAAAASLTWLKPGPDYPTVFLMLNSPNWVVRWQAVRILLRRSREEESEFAHHRTEVRKALTSQLEQGEQDPAVRREIAVLLQRTGSAEDTPYLVAMVDDRDPDVRSAVIEALALIKDQKAIEALASVRDGQDFRGRKIAQLANSAIQSITGGVVVGRTPRTAPTASVELAAGSWWWIGLLLVLPLLASVLPFSSTVRPSFSSMISSLMPDKAFDWLLVVGLLWGWIRANTAKGSKQKRFHVREDLAMTITIVLCTAWAVIWNIGDRPHITLPGLLLIAAAIGIAIGIPGGLVGTVRYGPFVKLAIDLLACAVFIISLLAALWIFHHFGGFLGFILAILAYFLSAILLYIPLFIVSVLAGGIATIIAMLGPKVIVGICIAGSLLCAWRFDLKISIFVGLTCILAIVVAEIVKRSPGANPVPALSKGMAVVLVIAYGVLAWVYFFGGWARLS